MLAGDLTNGGTPAEAEMLHDELAGIGVPTIAVLGNHDHDEGDGAWIAATLRDCGVHVLDGEGMVIDLAGSRVGVAGVMGGGGGFPGDPVARDVDAEMAARLCQGPEHACRLRSALLDLDCDVRIALMHFSPVRDTLVGEPPEIYPGLGCHELAEAIDTGRADLAVHGHAHHGSERGRTAGGTPVHNVAYPVLRRPYIRYELSPVGMGRG